MGAMAARTALKPAPALPHLALPYCRRLLSSSSDEEEEQAAGKME